MLLACVGVLGASGATASASVPHSVLYTSTDPGVGNIPSVGVEAYAFNQIGNEVILRRVAKIKSVTVQLSDWACVSGAWFSDDCATAPGATFTTPITLSIYKASTTDSITGETTPGGLLATVTKSFKIPFRPSASSHCTGAEAGEWFKNGQGCFNGLSHMITFTLSGLKTKLPRDVVWGVSYNSDSSGPEPIGGSNSPEDSLNVGLAPKVRVGTDRFPNTIFWDTRAAQFSCAADPPNGNDGPFVTGVFNLDGPCNGELNSYEGYVPAAQFNAVS
ncbi:MAG TPA: hypothetical protein VGL44_05250 [Gaiellales bacterium]